MKLAYYLYSWGNKKNYREYTKDELMNPDTVQELFDYCQILEAYITKQGWQFLIDYYGYEKLYEIDRKSGWLSECSDSDSLEEYIEWVKSETDAAEKAG